MGTDTDIWSRWPRRTRLTTLLLCAAVGLTCTRDLSIPDGAQSAPVRWPLTWARPPLGLVLASEARWQLDGSVTTLCSQSSVYAVRNDTVSNLRKGWRRLCNEDIYREKTRGRSDGSEAVLVSDGRLVRWLFASASVVQVRLRGSFSPRTPSWTPDGRSIVFASQAQTEAKDTTDGDGLFAVEPAGGEPRRIVMLPAGRIVSAVSWHPAQHELVVAAKMLGSGPGSTTPSIVVLDPAGQKNRLTIAAGYDPSWSPTGEWIAYVTWTPYFPQSERTRTTGDVATFSGQLRIVRPNGQDDRLLVQGSTPARAPQQRCTDGVPAGPLVWSPDGTAIAYAAVGCLGTEAWTVGIRDQVPVRVPQPP